MSWRGQGNTRECTLIASFYQTRKLQLIRKLESSLPVGRGASPKETLGWEIVRVYTTCPSCLPCGQTAPSAQVKTDPPDLEKPVSDVQPALGGSACQTHPALGLRVAGTRCWRGPLRIPLPRHRSLLGWAGPAQSLKYHPLCVLRRNVGLFQSFQPASGTTL